MYVSHSEQMEKLRRWVTCSQFDTKPRWHSEFIRRIHGTVKNPVSPIQSARNLANSIFYPHLWKRGVPDVNVTVNYHCNKLKILFFFLHSLLQHSEEKINGAVIIPVDELDVLTFTLFFFLNFWHFQHWSLGATARHTYFKQCWNM